MGLLSNKISRDKLKPGDHIYSWRTLYIYAHHGIYVDEGNVIQFTNPTGTASGTPIDSVVPSSASSSATGNPCPRCGFHSGLGGVISSCIDCFLAGHDLFLFEYDVSIPYFIAKFRGVCTIASSDPPEDVLHRAPYLLENGFGAYGLFKKNCEDFAIYCKTGRILIGNPLGNRIGQTLALASLSGLLFFTFGIGGATVSHSINRLIIELAMQANAVKVPVEILVSCFQSR